MRDPRTTIPEWELSMLRAIVDAKFPAQREKAFLEYLNEREKRRKYARVRNRKDRERRTLVGAHLSRADAEMVKFFADREDLSMTAFVRLALQRTMENSDTNRETGVFAVSVRRP